MTFDEFIFQNWTDNVRHKLRVVADRDDVRFLVSHLVDGKLTAVVFTEKPDVWPDNLVGVWSKRGDDAPKSKTMKALDLVLDDGLTAYAAAKQVGINQSAVHRALKRREGKDLCPSCGQVIRAFA
tara:strand:+ start:863 stop:1237 length:375 start_codon:yes stop_codon:yes gene_type:complete